MKETYKKVTLQEETIRRYEIRYKEGEHEPFYKEDLYNEEDVERRVNELINQGCYYVHANKIVDMCYA